MNTLLELRDVSVDLQIDNEAKPILRDVSFTLDTGEAVGLVGESGAGKSMVARAVTRMLPEGAVSRGEVRFKGEDVYQLVRHGLESFRRGGVALIPQDPQAAINPVYKVGDFLTEPLVAVSGLPKKEARDRAVNALEEVGISDASRMLDLFPHELSGGMLQRVMICAALLSESRLIVADEPTTALDATTQSEVMAILQDLRRNRDLGLLFISHDLELAAAICDRIAVMYAGEIVELQPARELEENPRHPYTKGLFLAAPKIDSTQEFLEAIPGRAVAAYEVGGGCGFANRCSWATPECEAARPPLEKHGAASIRCIRAEFIHEAGAEAGVRREKIEQLPAKGGEPVLEVAGLEKRFALRGSRRGDGFLAVDGVSFSLEPRGSIAVVGESGSGKTTVARMVAGLESPTSGKIEFGGEPSVRPRSRADRRRMARRIQMVFQNPYGSLDPRQTGQICLDEVLRVHTELGRQDRAERVTGLGDQVGLGQRELDLLPRSLSGGQRQRLAIARALAVEPEILILDEAVSALDVSVQAQILNLLVEIRGRLGLAYLFISHNLAVVRQISDQVVVMRHGEIVEAGPTASVLDNPQHPYTKLLRDSVPASGWQPTRRDHLEVERASSTAN